MRSTGGMSRHAREDATAVDDEAGTALVVRALRLAAGPGCWPLVERVFRDAYGPADGLVATCLFRILIQALALGARRPLRLGFVGAPDVTHDERALLQVIAAAREGDDGLLEASLLWLVRSRSAGPVGRTAIELARLMTANGAVLAR